MELTKLVIKQMFSCHYKENKDREFEKNRKLRNMSDTD